MSFWHFFLDLALSCALLIAAFVALVKLAVWVARRMARD